MAPPADTSGRFIIKYSARSQAIYAFPVGKNRTDAIGQLLWRESIVGSGEGASQPGAGSRDPAPEGRRQRGPQRSRGHGIHGRTSRIFESPCRAGARPEFSSHPAGRRSRQGRERAGREPKTPIPEASRSPVPKRGAIQAGLARMPSLSSRGERIRAFFPQRVFCHASIPKGLIGSARSATLRRIQGGRPWRFP